MRYIDLINAKPAIEGLLNTEFPKGFGRYAVKVVEISKKWEGAVEPIREIEKKLGEKMRDANEAVKSEIDQEYREALESEVEVSWPAVEMEKFYDLIPIKPSDIRALQVIGLE